ncbi:MAG: bifunctional folylpolyglutamate synthase/dihydrofolate synthase [Gemmatimonadaceae bacterium]
MLQPLLSTDYHAALDFLFSRTTGKTKVGLERTRALLAALGDPHLRVPAFHVAGTNGKGSVCATLEALLRRRGLRVGKYTSPHLVDFRERIVVNGRPMDEAGVVAWVERWTPECERLGATFFEATTAMAFDHFAAAGADVAVIETGLGGRLDSTNVIERPLAAAVTSIGIDHTEYLGDTKEAIAAEKAGIFKAGCPAVVADEDPEIRALLAQLASERGATPVRVVAREREIAEVAVGAWGTRFTLHRGGEQVALVTPLAGVHQATNAALAVAALDAAGAPYAPSNAELRAGLGDVFLAGRFQRVGRYVFDVAHNPDGAGVLARTLSGLAPDRPVVALLTVLADKDWRGMMRELSAVADRFVLTQAPTAPASRAWHAEEALAFARERGWDAVLEPDFDGALGRAAREGATVLVTGSFHTVGDAMARLQLSPLPG